MAALSASGIVDEVHARYQAQNSTNAEDTSLSSLKDTAQGNVQNTANPLDNEAGLRYAKAKPNIFDFPNSAKPRLKMYANK